MCENNEARTESIRQLLKLNHEVSHDLQSLLFLIYEIDQISKEKTESISNHMEDTIKKYSRFREILCDVSGINTEDGIKLLATT